MVNFSSALSVRRSTSMKRLTLCVQRRGWNTTRFWKKNRRLWVSYQKALPIAWPSSHIQMQAWRSNGCKEAKNPFLSAIHALPLGHKKEPSRVA